MSATMLQNNKWMKNSGYFTAAQSNTVNLYLKTCYFFLLRMTEASIPKFLLPLDYTDVFY